MKKLHTKSLGALAIAALLVAGCGDGRGVGGSGGGGAAPGPVMTLPTNAFDYVFAIVSAGDADTAEPVDAEQLMFSTSETEEPDPRV